MRFEDGNLLNMDYAICDTEKLLEPDVHVWVILKEDLALMEAERSHEMWERILKDVKLLKVTIKFNFKDDCRSKTGCWCTFRWVWFCFSVWQWIAHAPIKDTESNERYNLINHFASLAKIRNSSKNNKRKRELIVQRSRLDWYQTQIRGIEISQEPTSAKQKRLLIRQCSKARKEFKANDNNGFGT